MRASSGISSASEAVRVAAAVPVLVVMADDRQHQLQRAQRLADGLAGQRMLLHHAPLFRGEGLPAFLQNLVGYADLAQIVQIAAALQRHLRIAAPAPVLAQSLA